MLDVIPPVLLLFTDDISVIDTELDPESHRGRICVVAEQLLIDIVSHSTSPLFGKGAATSRLELICRLNNGCFFTTIKHAKSED